jgi:phosphoribosylpyrophosphate synthetase
MFSLCLQDDMVDDVQSFVAAAEVLKERGAYKIYVLATHGLLSSDAPRLIEDSPIDEASSFVNMTVTLDIVHHLVFSDAAFWKLDLFPSGV